ncbi:MAG: hypothetical protein SNJ77_01295 [Cytophagales bacterium]
MILFFSCERSINVKLEGNSICASKEFRFIEELSVNKTNIDLNTEDFVNIKAKFNESLKWKLEIKGQSSGARKVFIGQRSDSVNIKWFGNPSFPKFFEKEKCTVILSVDCDNIFTTEFELMSKPEFKRNTAFSLYYSDFSNSTNWVYGPDRLGFVSGTANDTIVLIDTSLTNTSLGLSPHGGRFARYRQQRNNSTWYFGLVAQGSAENANFLNRMRAMSSDPGRFYLNFFYAGGINTPNNEVFVTLGSGKFARFVLEPEWKLGTIKFSDVFVDNYNQLNNRFEFALQSFPTRVNVGELNLDFAVLTIDEPFFDYNVSQ